jgi:DNA-binding transcriptional MerR regulator
MSVDAERARVQHLFAQVEVIEEVAESLDVADERRGRLLDAAAAVVADCGPIRAGIAAGLLDLSEPTVRIWAKEGVLAEAAQRSSRLLLDPSSLHEVMHLVRDLRRAGRTKGLLEAVWRRLSDQALLDREDLAESIEQMQRGEGHEINPDDLRI